MKYSCNVRRFYMKNFIKKTLAILGIGGTVFAVGYGIYRLLKKKGDKTGTDYEL